MFIYEFIFVTFLLLLNTEAVVAFQNSVTGNNKIRIAFLSNADGFAFRSSFGSSLVSRGSTWRRRIDARTEEGTWLYGKKKKGGGGRPYGGSSSQQPPQEKQSVKDARFDSMTRQFMFSILNLNKVLPDKSKTLLKNINLCFYPGAKIGVVGLNGSGKSTLLRIMAGLDTEFDGIARPLPGARIGYLPQEPTLQYPTVQECVDAAVQSSRTMLQNYNDLSCRLADPSLDESEMTALMNQLSSLGDEIESKNLWDLDRIVDRAMDSLRLPPGDTDTQVLSGGERRRVSLCQLLLGNYDMLLLDEPTNHLDTESIAWLEQFLDQYKGTVVAITHDRYFLENVAKWILELDRGEGIPFEGNYSDWLEEKRKRLEAENKLQTAASRAVEAELEWVRSNPKGKSTKSKARLKRYEELLAAAAPPELRTAGQIYIPPGPRLGDVVIDVSGLRKTFGDKLLFDGLEFSLPPAGIVGIIGPNGAGKSTLIKMLMGMDTPDKGTIEVGSTVKLVGVQQDRMEELNPQNTVFEEITSGLDEIELGTQIVASRAYVSWFGFKSAQQQAIVGNLSGGERNRVQLAKLLKTGANLIILGE